jgi:hypothetical protein
MYPNIPIVIKSGDKIFFSFTNGVQEINLLTFGVNRCRIACYNGSSTYDENYARVVHYTRGDIYLSNLISSGITKLQVIVGSSANNQWRSCVAPRANVPNNSGHYAGGVSSIRINNTTIISSSSVSGYFSNCASGNTTRLSEHGYIVITALEDGYKLSDHQLQIKTSRGVKNFPLYQGNPPASINNLDVILPGGEKAFALTSTSTQPLDSIALKNPGMKYVMDANAVGGSGEGSSGSSNAIPSGRVELLLGGCFRVPQNITSILAQSTYNTSKEPNCKRNMGSAYFRVSPGQIISTTYCIHKTYYSWDNSIFVYINSVYFGGHGRIPSTRGGGHGGGWLWLGPTIITYSASINKRGGSGLPLLI